MAQDGKPDRPAGNRRANPCVAAREVRSARALRENLRRRKAQARNRRADRKGENDVVDA